MPAALWMLLVLVGWQDADALILKLGSARFVEREEAGLALRKLGREALPALRRGAADADLEVRTRAGAILGEIESEMMVEPTLVRLDFRDQTLAEIARNLSEQSRIAVLLEPENDPRWNGRKVSLEASEPVPLWEALERLSREAELRVVANAGVVAFSRQPSARVAIHLVPADDPAVPSAVAGAFRASAFNIQHHRDRFFDQGTRAALANANGVIVRGGQVGGLGGAQTKDGVPGFATENFSVGIQLNAEPRMSIAQAGLVRVLEATDDQGRSLATPQDPNAAPRFPNMNVYNHFGASTLQVQVPLRLAGEGSAAVKTLRMVVPIVATARKEVPFVIPLAGSKGKTFQNERITIQVHDVRPDPNEPTTTLDLTVRFRDGEGGNTVGGRQNLEMMAFRNPMGGGLSQVEIVDAQGRVYAQWPNPNPQPGQDGLKLSLRLMQAEGLGPPAELRYYEIAKTETDVTFELKDIPMP